MFRNNLAGNGSVSIYNIKYLQSQCAQCIGLIKLERTDALRNGHIAASSIPLLYVYSEANSFIKGYLRYSQHRTTKCKLDDKWRSKLYIQRCHACWQGR